MKNRKAFSMIELIFVIVVLGILAAVAVPKLAEKRLGKDNVIVQVGAELRQEFEKIDCEGYRDKLTIQENRNKELLAEIQELREKETQLVKVVEHVEAYTPELKVEAEKSAFVPSYAPIGTGY